jgi:hypothetical protein
MSSIITEEAINALPFDKYFEKIVVHPTSYSSHDITEFFDKCGKQHYRLLAYLSTLFNNASIIDIKTQRGHSALALSYNETNTVHTFDIGNNVANTEILKRPNISFHREDDIFQDAGFNKWKETILNSKFIFVDVEPHNGHMEMELYNRLASINYEGFIVFDDIWYFKEMRDVFWYNINDSLKYDLTLVGHDSGTGVIDLSGKFSTLYGEKADVSNWTLVTAYFNLAKCCDASKEIKERDKTYYMSHSMSTLKLPYNLVIYCDEESVPAILEARITSKWLANRTHIVIREFEELRFKKKGRLLDETFVEYRNKINENRKTHPYNFDNRNTASYYLFCMSRYLMLKEVIDTNPFGSTHFGWINFCIERMGYSNLVHLEESMAVNRDKFSTCYINYIEPELITNNVKEYFAYGRCSMCSGFFTGNLHYMWLFCDLVEDKFLEYLEKGYGHADEQLYSPVYFDTPSIFEHYYGDYNQMITNYKYIYENPISPIVHFIRNSYEKCNYVKCLEACKFLKKSVDTGKSSLEYENISNLNFYMNECKTKLGVA